MLWVTVKSDSNDGWMKGGEGGGAGRGWGGGGDSHLICTMTVIMVVELWSVLRAVSL